MRCLSVSLPWLYFFKYRAKVSFCYDFACRHIPHLIKSMAHCIPNKADLENLICLNVYGRNKFLVGMCNFLSMLSGSLLNTAWHVLRLRMEEAASRYGG
jgi:hypothetical protein